jgi:uncharacterized membrane protein
MGGMPGAAGSNRNLYTILAWALLPPIGSLVFLFVGKDDADVKYNAAEALVIHGGMFVVWLVLRILSIVVFPIVFVLLLWEIAWFVVWLIGLIMALQANGSRVNYPVLGPMAASYVPQVEAWAK